MDCCAIDYKNIPVQADIIAGIIRLDVDSNSCFGDLDNYVRSDQGVATLVLRVVNSPLYSRGKKIATIPMAISVLGFNVVRSLAMLAFSRSLFSKTQIPLFRIHLWQHSLLTALAGQVICQEAGWPRDKDEAFIAGLMHDMGKVLLFNHDQAAYLEVLRQVVELGVADIDAEQAVFGCDHCLIGREAVMQWKLPEHFADYMGRPLQGTTDLSATTPARRSLLAANTLIEGVGIGARATPDLAVRRDRLQACGLDAAQVEHCVNDDFIHGLMQSDTYQLCASF